MDKIASPTELQAELRSLMAYVQGHGPEGRPDREVVASKIRDLADRVAAERTADLFDTDAAELAALLGKKWRNVKYNKKTDIGYADVGSPGKIEFNSSSNDYAVIVRFVKPLEFKAEPARMIKILEAVNKLYNM